MERFAVSSDDEDNRCELNDSDLDNLQSAMSDDDNDDTDFYFPPNEAVPRPIKPNNDIKEI